MRTITQYTLYLFALFLVISSVATPSQAQTAPPPHYPPEWSIEQVVDTSVFRSVIEVPPFRIDVPTVVAVPIEGDYYENKTAVVKDSAGTFHPVFYNVTRESSEPSVYVNTNVAPFESGLLYDDDIETVVVFPFEEASQNEAEIKVGRDIMYQDKVTATGLRFALQKNAALPETVSVQASSDGPGLRTVVAERPVTGRIISFPETVAGMFVVRFGLSQPLYLAEVDLIQEPEVTTSHALRFLAQPGESYTIYIDAEESYGRVMQSEANLRNDEGVLQLITGGVAQPVPNQMYVPSDTDNDGVRDQIDNCPRVANQTQEDVDKNGVGDACDDFDRDRIMTVDDNCPTVPNRNQRDTDGDGIGDACDTNENRFTERNPWIPWAGMGIAVVVLVGLLFMSLRLKAPVPERKDEQEEGEQDNTHEQ